MNKTLRIEANRILIRLLDQCTEPQQLMFKRIFSHKNIDLTLMDIVMKMPDDKIDSAIGLCERTLAK